MGLLWGVSGSGPVKPLLSHWRVHDQQMVVIVLSYGRGLLLGPHWIRDVTYLEQGLKQFWSNLRHTFKKSWWNSHNIKFTVLIIFKGTIQWRLMHPQCVQPSTLSSAGTFSSLWKEAPRTLSHHSSFCSPPGSGRHTFFFFLTSSHLWDPAVLTVKGLMIRASQVAVPRRCHWVQEHKLRRGSSVEFCAFLGMTKDTEHSGRA